MMLMLAHVWQPLYSISNPNANHMGDLSKMQMQTGWAGVGRGGISSRISHALPGDGLLLLGGPRAQVPSNSWLIVDTL